MSTTDRFSWDAQCEAWSLYGCPECGSTDLGFYGATPERTEADITDCLECNACGHELQRPNAERIGYGEAAVRAGSERDTPASELRDTLANVLHWALDRGLDVEAALASAREHLEVEAPAAGLQRITVSCDVERVQAIADELNGQDYICGVCGEPRAPHSGTCAVCLAADGASALPDPPEDLADAWARFQRGERVEPYELRALDEWRGDCADEAGF